MVLIWVSPWQVLIEPSLTLSWWRHAPRAIPKWPVPQAGHLGMSGMNPWNGIKAIWMYRGQIGVDAGKLIEHNMGLVMCFEPFLFIPFMVRFYVPFPLPVPFKLMSVLNVFYFSLVFRVYYFLGYFFFIFFIFFIYLLNFFIHICCDHNFLI